MSSNRDNPIIEIARLLKGLTDEQLAEAVKRIREEVYESRANNQGFHS